MFGNYYSAWEYLAWKLSKEWGLWHGLRIHLRSDEEWLYIYTFIQNTSVVWVRDPWSLTCAETWSSVVGVLSLALSQISRVYTDNRSHSGSGTSKSELAPYVECTGVDPTTSSNMFSIGEKLLYTHKVCFIVIVYYAPHSRLFPDCCLYLGRVYIDAWY